MEQARDRKKRKEGIDKWSVTQQRIVTTEAIDCTWNTWNNDIQKRKIVVQAFKDIGIMFSINGSRDAELKIKGFAPGELIIGDWTRSTGVREDEEGFEISEKENWELPAPTNDQIEYQLQDK